MTRWPVNDDTSKLFPLYSRANIGEIFPDPISPLNASAGFQFHLEIGWRAAWVACDVWDDDLYHRDAEPVQNLIVPAFNNFMYINMSLMRLFGVRVPGMTPEIVDYTYFGDMPGIPSYASERRDFDEAPAFTEKAGAWLVGDVLGRTHLDEFDHDRDESFRVRDTRPDLTTLSDQEVLARFFSFDEPMQRHFTHHIESSLKAGVGLGAVAAVAESVGRPELALQLLAGIGDVDSTGPSHGIWSLSRAARTGKVGAAFDEGVDGLHERLHADTDPEVVAFTEQFDRFVAEWEFRGPAEWEIRTLTWGVDPTMVLATVERMRHVDDDGAPQAKNVLRAAEREAAEKEIRAALAGNDEALAQAEASLRAGALWIRARERSRTASARLLHELRLCALELGRRATEAGTLDHPQQIFMLYADELRTFPEVTDGRWLETVRQRERDYLALFDVIPPFVVAGEVPPLETWERKDAQIVETLTVGESIEGVPGCGGVIRGRARVVLRPDDPSAVEPGEILVAPITDPSWTPLFMAAGGVVADVGAPFSHAAIVSRELGIPCAVSVGKATKRIPDGSIIEVNGTTGVVTLIETADALVPQQA